MTFKQKLKQLFWKMIYPFFPFLQRESVGHGIVHHEGRQRYHLGWLSSKHTLAELKDYLNTKWGFGNHFIAWQDDDQVLSWRKFDGFEYQYHLRVYKDGEIRGHYEITPEAHPIKHIQEVGEIDKTNDFLTFLGDFVIKTKYIHHLKREDTSHQPEAVFNPNEKRNL